MAVNMETIEKLPLVQKVLIVVGIILLVYVLFYFGYVNSKHKDIEKKQADLTKLQYEVSQGKAVQAKIEEYERKKVELEKQLKEAEKRLPRDAKIPQLLETISDLARGNTLQFPKFKPGKTTTGCGGICKQIALEVELTGTYNNIAVFLDQLSKLERIVGVSSLQLTPNKKKTKKGAAASASSAEQDLKASTKLVTYMFAGRSAAPPQKGEKGKKKSKKKKGK